MPSGSRSGNKNWVVFLLMLPIWMSTLSCSRTDTGIVLWSNRWLTRSRWTFVARPNKAICDSKEKKESLIFLLTPSDKASTSSITIVRCLNSWCGFSKRIPWRLWIIDRHWLKLSLISDTKSDLERFSLGWMTAIWFCFAQREGVSNLGSTIIRSEIFLRILNR